MTIHKATVMLAALLVGAASVSAQQVERLTGTTWVNDTTDQTITVAKDDFGEGTFDSTDYFVWERNGAVYRVRKSNVDEPLRKKLQKAVDANGSVVLTTKSSGRLDDGAAK